jgi:hypothetical protein
VEIVFLVLVLDPETETSSLYCYHSSRFHLKTETESSLRNVLLEVKDSTAWLSVEFLNFPHLGGQRQERALHGERIAF